MCNAVKDSLKEAMRATLTEMRTSNPNFKPRPGQNRMFAEVAKTLSGAYEREQHGIRSIVIEGETGVGKTVGYLMPAIHYALSENKKRDKDNPLKVVVATANVALQQQILNSDLPKLNNVDVLSNVQSELVVGRGRYFCVRDAIGVATTNVAQDDLVDSGPSLASQAEDLVHTFQDGGWSGLRDDLQTDVSDLAWSRVSANADTCSNNKCPHYDSCPFVSARKRMENADVIVTNHSTVYANLRLIEVRPEAAILPDLENTLLIMDEAHHIPVSYRDSGVLEFNAKDISTIIKSKKAFKTSIKALALKARISPQGLDAIDDQIANLDRALNRFVEAGQTLIAKNSNERATNHYRFSQGRVDDQLLEILSNELAASLHNVLEIIRPSLDKVDKTVLSEMQNNPSSAKHVLTIKSAIKIIENALETIDKTQGSSGYQFAKWVSKQPHSRNVGLHFTPLNVAPSIYTNLVQSHYASVFTSATMRSLGKFSHFVREMGFKKDDGTSFMLAESPFDYQRATLHIDKNMVPPQQEAEHTKAIAGRLKADYLDQHKAGLLLFSSKRQMNSFLETMDESLKAVVLAQYTAPRSELIRRHKQNIDDGKCSLLVGVQSFSEGLDLPGKYLTYVGIAKIPFSDISSPIDSAVTEAIENSQSGSAFIVQMLPDASKRLIQSVGRLMRSNECYGDVHIYDSRLLKKRYGMQLIDALPQMNRQF